MKKFIKGFVATLAMGVSSLSNANFLDAQISKVLMEQAAISVIMQANYPGNETFINHEQDLLELTDGYSVGLMKASTRFAEDYPRYRRAIEALGHAGSGYINHAHLVSDVLIEAIHDSKMSLDSIEPPTAVSSDTHQWRLIQKYVDFSLEYVFLNSPAIANPSSEETSQQKAMKVKLLVEEMKDQLVNYQGDKETYIYKKISKNSRMLLSVLEKNPYEDIQMLVYQLSRFLVDDVIAREISHGSLKVASLD